MVRVVGTFIGEIDPADLPQGPPGPPGPEGPQGPPGPPQNGGLRREDCGPRERTEPMPEPPTGRGIEITPSTPWSIVKNAEPGVPVVLTSGVYPWIKRAPLDGWDMRMDPGASFDGGGAYRLMTIRGAGNDIIGPVMHNYTSDESKQTGTIDMDATASDARIWFPDSVGAGQEAIHLAGRRARLYGGVLRDSGTVTVNGGGDAHIVDGTAIYGGARDGAGRLPGHCGAMKFGHLSNSRLVCLFGENLNGPLVWLDVGCSDNEVAHGVAVGGDGPGLHFEIGRSRNYGHHMDFRNMGRLHVGSGDGWRSNRYEGAALLIHNSPEERYDYCYVEVSGDHGGGACIWDQAGRRRGDGSLAVSDGSAICDNWFVVTSEPRGKGWLMGLRGSITPDRVTIGGNVYVVPVGFLDYPFFRLEHDNVTFTVWAQAFPTDTIREEAA